MQQRAFLWRLDSRGVIGNLLIALIILSPQKSKPFTTDIIQLQPKCNEIYVQKLFR